MSIDFEAIAGGSLGVGKLVDIPDPNDRRDLLGRLDKRTSRMVTVPGSYQAAATALTYCFLSFVPVSPFKVWQVTRIGVTGPDPFTSLAGVTVAAFKGITVPQDSNTEPQTFGDLLAVLGSVPNTTFPMFGSITLRSSERVFLVFKGLANAQQIQASMDVVEHDQAVYLATILSTAR